MNKLSPTTAIHASEIRFACPLWCKQTRGEHLEDIGNHAGRVIHWSHDITGDGWWVAISTMTYPDGTACEGGALGVQVEAENELTADAAVALREALIKAVQMERPELS